MPNPPIPGRSRARRPLPISQPSPRDRAGTAGLAARAPRPSPVSLGAVLVLVLLAFAWPAPPAVAQGTKADYERAAGLRKLTENKVLNRRLEPQWLTNQARFWYRREVAGGGHEFMLVDAARAERKPAFDHARLTEALTQAGIHGVKADQLPLESLDFNSAADAIRFRLGPQEWLLSVPSYDLKRLTNAATSGLAPDPAARASRRTGAETTLIFENRTMAAVELSWLDPDGKKQAYGRVGAGERKA